MKQPKKIAIIGGGAAGMMCAATLLEQGATADFEVHLFDTNKQLGTKVLISGGGRCNVTTGITDRKLLLTKYPRGAKFLIPVLNAFGPAKVRKRFEDHGVPLKCEEDMRIFPVSNNGKEVVGVFEQIFTKNEHMHLHLQSPVQSLDFSSSQFHIQFQTKGSDQVQQLDADFLVLATGGNAFAHTGSKGDGYAFVQALGHTVTDLGPSLNSFLCQEEWVKKCSGLSFENALITYGAVKVRGPVLLTHFGISGPAVFAFSAQIPYVELKSGGPVIVSLKPFGDRSFERWTAFLLEKAQTEKLKQIITVLDEHFPKRFIEALLEHLGIEFTTRMTDFTKEQRAAIAHALGDGFPVTLTARRPGDEFVTAGGVKLDEVDNKTMMSTLCPNCYLVGELLDIDGVTGGFNLQSSRATGRLAGLAIATRLVDEQH